MLIAECRYFDNWRKSGQNDVGLCGSELPISEREDLAHTIAYPTKTKPARNLED
jgi:hypothetical protein